MSAFSIPLQVVGQGARLDGRTYAELTPEERCLLLVVVLVLCWHAGHLLAHCVSQLLSTDLLSWPPVSWVCLLVT